MQVANDPAQVDDAANDGADAASDGADAASDSAAAAEVEAAARVAVESALQAWDALNHDEPPESLKYLYTRSTDQRVVLSFSSSWGEVDYFEDGKWTTPPDSESIILIDNIRFTLNDTNAYQIDHMLRTIVARAPPAVKDRAYTIILDMLDELHLRSPQVTNMQLLLDLIIERHADTHISIG